MNETKYKRLLYFIVTTIFLTIGVQCYWNYKNYQQNKLQFINQVQISLDNALEVYYANLVESKQVIINDLVNDSLAFNQERHPTISDSLFENIKIRHKNEVTKDIPEGVQIRNADSGYTFSISKNEITKIKVIREKEVSDSLNLLKDITSIFISMRDESLKFSKLNPLLIKELDRKKINIPFALKHFKNDSLLNSFNNAIIKTDFLKTSSKTKFLKENETLELVYPNATKIILTRGLSGISLSFLLAAAIIACLFYLLKIIKHQKQLATVKNDLISNITHEFKTPIATIGVALESIKDFNVIEDREKTENYLDISSHQLTKLTVIVEKLLETATLDSENLNLKKETIDIVELLLILVKKHQIQTEIKTLQFTSTLEALMVKVDVFHFENALNNILDNAIKYGGNIINIGLFKNDVIYTISISDNGNTLTKQHKEKIFEKFYRVPKGNTHDVKGFGIGLYYAKKIVEKHGGTIQLDLENTCTTFKISLPNA